jgi:hypothetical protein
MTIFLNLQEKYFKNKLQRFPMIAPFRRLRSRATFRRH